MRDPSLLMRPPGPPPLSLKTPIAVLKYLKSISDIAQLVRRRFEEYGDIYYARLGKSEIYVIRRPEHVRQVFQVQGSRYGKATQGTSARLLREFLGDGLLNSNGDFWKTQRRMINPAFRKDMLTSHAPMMVEATRAMLDRWSAGEVRDVSDEMMGLTLSIATKAFFDHDIEGIRTVAEAMDTIRDGFTSPSLRLPPWVPSPARRRVERALKDMDDLIYGLIDARTRELASGVTEDRQDLLSVMVRLTGEDAGSPMSRKLLRDELMTLMVAGHETTSHALTWTFYLLGEHPEVESKLMEELREVLGGRAPTVDDLKRLPWLEAVLKESMRLYPPAYVVSRVAEEDAELDEYVVPAGAEVIVWLYWTHRDPRWWPEPLAFRPERFSAEHESEIPKGAYVPFAAGTRSCIGKRFAMMEAQLILAAVLQRFQLERVPGHLVVPRRAVTMSPKHGMKMRLIPRA